VNAFNNSYDKYGTNINVKKTEVIVVIKGDPYSRELWYSGSVVTENTTFHEEVRK